MGSTAPSLTPSGGSPNAKPTVKPKVFEGVEEADLKSRGTAGGSEPNHGVANLEDSSEIPPTSSTVSKVPFEADPSASSAGCPTKPTPDRRAQEGLGEEGARGALMANQSPRSEEAHLLFVQLVEERNLLKHQIALLEEKLAQQNETLKAVYRERDEFRERLRWEQRQSNQLKRALESMLERTAEARTVAPLGGIDLAPKEPPLTSRTDGGIGEPTPHREGWSLRPEDRAPAPTERSPQNETTDVGPVLAPETQGPAPNKVVLLRPLTEPMPLSPAAPRGVPNHSLARAETTAETTTGATVETVAEAASSKEDLEKEFSKERDIQGTAATVAPPLRREGSGIAPEPTKLSRPRPMLPAFASRSQPVGAKFLSENSPAAWEVNRRRGERPDVDCSERPERPVGGQVAPPSFWQDLQKGTPPKGSAPPPRKRVTAFAAIQLPDFPPLR